MHSFTRMISTDNYDVHTLLRATLCFEGTQTFTVITTQLMPVTTTQEHTQLAETVLHAQTRHFVSILRAKKLFARPSCGHSQCEDDCRNK